MFCTICIQKAENMNTYCVQYDEGTNSDEIDISGLLCKYKVVWNVCINSASEYGMPGMHLTCKAKVNFVLAMEPTL
jgi:hypothetical protein